MPTIMQWLNYPHLQQVVTAIVAFGIAYTPVASFIASKVQRPLPTAPVWKRLAYDFFVDTPAWCAALGRVGIFGGKFNLPLVPSRQVADNPPSAPPMPPIKPSGVVVLLGVLLASGCYCWQSQHVQEPKCIVMHQTVDCTVSSIKQAVPFLIPVIQALFAGGNFDVAALENFAKGAGFSLVGCAVAQLENDFKTAKPAPGGPEKLYQAHNAFTEWKAKYHQGVQFKLPGGALR